MIYPRTNNKRRNRRVYTNCCCRRCVVCFHWYRIILTCKHIRLTVIANVCILIPRTAGCLVSLFFPSLDSKYVDIIVCCCVYPVIIIVLIIFPFYIEYIFNDVCRFLLQVSSEIATVLCPVWFVGLQFECDMPSDLSLRALSTHKHNLYSISDILRMLIFIISIPLMIEKLFFPQYYVYCENWDINPQHARREGSFSSYHFQPPPRGEHECLREFWMVGSDSLIMMVWNHILIVCCRISFCLFFRQLFPPLLDLLLKCLFSLYTSICLWLYVWKCFNRRNSGCYVFELDWELLNRNIIIITISWWKKAFEIWYNNAILRSLGCSDNNAAIMLLAFVVKSQVLHPQPAPFGFVAPHSHIKDIAFTTLLSKHNMYTYIFHNTHFT